MNISKYATSFFYTILIIITLSVLGFLVYSNALHAPFIFDDNGYIAANHQIRDISNFLKDFSGTRYAAFLSFAVNYYFGGLNTFGYHLVNIAIHILNSILVYFLVQSMIRSLGFKYSRVEADTCLLDPLTTKTLPLAVSLIFLVHPIQTQAVTYISQRFTSLATFFYLLALVLYVKYRLGAIGNGQWEKPITYRLSPIAYCLSIIFTILAMKTKEISFTLPIIIILYEFIFLNNCRFRQRILYLLPFALTLAIIPLSLFISGTGSAFEEVQRQAKIQDLTTLSKYQYLLTQFNVIITYLRLLFFPVNQHFVYDYPISKSIFEIRTFLSFLFLLSFFLFAVYLCLLSHARRNTYGLLIAFGIIWFFVTLSVESSVIPIINVIFEHRVYLPSIGIILSAVTAYYYLFNHIQSKTAKIFLSFLILAAILSLPYATYKRNAVYKDLLTIWRDEAIKSPNRAAIRTNLGLIYLDRDMVDEAEREFKIAVELSPLSPVPHRNLGLIYEKKGMLDEAEGEYKRAIRFSKYESERTFIDPLLLKSQSHTGLGRLYYKKGLYDNAIEEYEKAVKLNPSADLYNDFGILYGKMGMFDKAIEKFNNAIKIEPNDATAYFNKAFALENKDMIDMALKGYKEALTIDPNFKQAREAISRLSGLR